MSRLMVKLILYFWIVVVLSATISVTIAMAIKGADPNVLITSTPFPTITPTPDIEQTQVATQAGTAAGTAAANVTVTPSLPAVTTTTTPSK